MIDLDKIYKSNNYGDFKIVNYTSCSCIEVQFTLTGYKSITQASHINRGLVKDPLYPSIYGVGFVGIGTHIPTSNKLNNPSYEAWRGMIRRCYDTAVHEKHPTYKDCTVCSEWHNYQNFASWFDLNNVDGYDLDKDIKIDGNKLYSPDTCLFVSPKNNKIKAFAKRYIFLSPTGDVVNIYNLADFCRKNNLQKSHMVGVNLRKRKHHKGWTKA